jgi:hypothetical protein
LALGAGVEYAFWTRGNQSLTGFAEGDCYGFGTRTVGLTTVTTNLTTQYDIRERKCTARLGVNLKFGMGGVVTAKY